MKLPKEFELVENVERNLRKIEKQKNKQKE